MPGELPTYKTLKDIENLGITFNASCQKAYQDAAERYGIMSRYILIQDPDHPTDTNARVWHPNMHRFYTPEQLTWVKENVCDLIIMDYQKWKNTAVTQGHILTAMFDVTPALDKLVSQGLAMMISG